MGLTFREAHSMAEGWRAFCQICAQPIDAAVVVDFIPGRSLPLGPDISIRENDRAVLLVGPCGHSSHDVVDGFLYEMFPPER